jgi:hypothetical protein
MSDTMSSPSPSAVVGVGPGGTLTEAEARALLEEQPRSGLSFTEFARSKGLPMQRLGWWKARLTGKLVDRSVHATSRTRATTTPHFVPVIATSAASAAPTHRTASTAAVVPAARGVFELALPGALTLRIPHDFHEGSLARILRVLREAP